MTETIDSAMLPFKIQELISIIMDRKRMSGVPPSSIRTRRNLSSSDIMPFQTGSASSAAMSS